jgi:hypothetical protein
MLRLGRLLLFAFLLALTGCSVFMPSADPRATKDKDLRVSFEMSGWAATDPRESDLAWAQQQSGDVMVVNSFCGEFQSLPLETLAVKTFKDYPDFRPLGKNTLEWHGREAFEMEAEANVDGVKVLLHLRNYRRDHCYYDFVLISPRSRSQASLQAFATMVSGVEFR